MPHSSHNGEKKSSGKSHGDPGKHSKPSEETTSNVGYVSHRQAWAERKKKKSPDKVSWPYSVQKLGVPANTTAYDEVIRWNPSWDSGRNRGLSRASY